MFRSRMGGVDPSPYSQHHHHCHDCQQPTVSLGRVGNKLACQFGLSPPPSSLSSDSLFLPGKEELSTTWLCAITVWNVSPWLADLVRAVYLSWKGRKETKEEERKKKPWRSFLKTRRYLDGSSLAFAGCRLHSALLSRREREREKEL